MHDEPSISDPRNQTPAFILEPPVPPEGESGAEPRQDELPVPATDPRNSSMLWDRIVEIGDCLAGLTADKVEERLAELAAAGEPPSVLARVRLYLGIPRHTVDSPAGTVVGGEYRIASILGSGGMGIVYEAVLIKTGQTVALKMIQPGLILDHMRDRFLQEMKALGRLDHPGIIEIRHAGHHAGPNGTGSEFFTMERIAGSSLREYLASPDTTLTERLRVIRDAAIAVQYAHDRAVIHRDLKPGNMMIRQDGRVVIFDFGLSAALVFNEDAPFAIGAEGTPPYMAPEQAEAAPPTPAADIYSLGAILYEMLSGQPIYHLPPQAPRSVKLEAVRNPPPRPSLQNPDIPPALDDILDKALARQPADRFSSAAAFARAINRLLPAHLVNEPPHKWHPAAGVTIPATDWVLEEKLGDGAHGQVWLARNRPVLTSSEDPLIPLPRVYKFCASEDAARSLRREQRVFLALKRAVDAAAPRREPSSIQEPANSPLDLPGFVPLEAWSLDEPPYYIAMRWIEGACDLREWLLKLQSSGDLPHSSDAANGEEPGESAAVSIVCDIAGALQFASQNGVLHRDVSPANILVRNDPAAPGGVRAWLVDFGLAAFDANFARSLLTNSITDPSAAKLVGSPEYIAPEIKRGSPATTRSDLYSLGVVLYRLLRRDLTAPLTEWKLHITNRFLLDDLDHCLADRPENRFASASALVSSLQNLPARSEAALRAAVAAARAREEREREFAAVKRSAYRKGVIKATALSLMLALVLGGILWYAFNQSAAARDAETSAHSQSLSAVLSKIHSLGNERGPGRLERALELARHVNPLNETEKNAIRDGLAEILELDDWELTSVPGKAPGAILTAIIMDGVIIRVLASGSAEMIGEDGKIRWSRPVDPATNVIGLSPDKRWVCFGAARELSLWEASTGSPFWKKQCVKAVRAMAWHPDSKQFAVCLFEDQEPVTEIFTCQTSHPLFTLTRSEPPFARNSRGLAYSKNGRRLAQWSEDSLNLLIWHMGTKTLDVSAFHPTPVRQSAWSDSYLATISQDDGFLNLWDLEAKDALGTVLEGPVVRLPLGAPRLTGHHRKWTSLAAGTDIVGVADTAGSLFCFDLETCAQLLETPPGPEVISISADKTSIAVVRKNGSLDRYLRASSPVFRLISGPGEAFVEDFDVNAEGTMVAVAGVGGLGLYDSAGVRISQPASPYCRGVRFESGNSVIFSDKSRDSSFQYPNQPPQSTVPGWETLLKNKKEGNSAHPARLCFDQSGKYLATARLGEIGWCGQGSAPPFTHRITESEAPQDLAISETGDCIAWTGTAHAWLAWPAMNRIHKLNLPNPVTRLCLARGLCAAGSAFGCFVFDLSEISSPVKIRGLEPSSILELALSQDSQLAAAALPEGGVLLGILDGNAGWNWTPVVRLGASRSRLFSRLRFCGRGRWLGAVDSGGKLALWNIAALLGIFSQCGCFRMDNVYAEQGGVGNDINPK